MTTSVQIDDRPGAIVPPHGTADQAVEYFAARLRFLTDVSDVHAALESGTPQFVLVDTRGEASWRQGRIPGAVHLPTREIAGRAPAELGADTLIVTYCWGPGCDGGTRGALEFAKLGYRVKEMIGGFEYWVREGFPVDTDAGQERHPADPLTAPTSAITCDC